VKGPNPKALALSDTGRWAAKTGGGSVDEAIRRTLGGCGIMSGVLCKIVAVNDAFVVPIPTLMKATGLPGVTDAIAPERRENLSLRLHDRTERGCDRKRGSARSDDRCPDRAVRHVAIARGTIRERCLSASGHDSTRARRRVRGRLMCAPRNMGARELGATTCLSSACGAASSTRRSTCEPTTASARPAPRSHHLPAPASPAGLCEWDCYLGVT
jgi:hypothetical protein